MSKQYLNKSKNYSRLLIVIRIVFVLSIIISMIYIIKWNHDNKSTTELNNYLSQYITINSDDIEDFLINFDKLKQENNYFYAWIIVNGTNINYPVVHYTDNEYYLTHAFDNTSNNAGCPFIDYRAKCNGNDKNLVIYAHNRKDR